MDPEIVHDGTIIQRFIPPLGKSIEKVRIIFHNPRCSSNESEPDFGVVISNKKLLNGDLKNAEENCWKTAAWDIENVNIYKVSGKSLKKYQISMQLLMLFLEYNFEIKLQNIIADFIIDKQRKMWFIDLVSFKQVETKENLKSIARIKGREELKIAKRRCKCCGELRLEKFMQNKVVMSLARKACEHMKNRGINFFEEVEVFLLPL